MQLHIKNFRAIKEASIDLAPLTVIYGANGSGKSSLIYALLTLKNLVLNPNQSPGSFFNYNFVNLGGYEAVVFDHKIREKIELGVRFDNPNSLLEYAVTFDENNGSFALTVGDGAQQLQRFFLDVSFPYPLNQEASQRSLVTQGGITFGLSWNGVTATVKTGDSGQSQIANNVAAILNSPAEALRRIQVVPLKRGFSKPHFSSVSISPMPITEDEVATFLANSKYLVPKISKYLEEIVGHDLRVNYLPGTSIFSLDSTDRQTGVATELVNEGFGVNQVVHFLAVCLNKDAELVCVEEPEIHLHPTAVRRLAKALVEISEEEDKKFLISTHSDAFLFALLTLVAQGKMKPDNLACYFAHKKGRKVQFERQNVNDKGQIEGGLTSFLEGELEDIRTLLHVPELAAN